MNNGWVRGYVCGWCPLWPKPCLLLKLDAFHSDVRLLSVLRGTSQMCAHLRYEGSSGSCSVRMPDSCRLFVKRFHLASHSRAAFAKTAKRREFLVTKINSLTEKRTH
ncbi:hypothetical protein CBL_04226 [Carabus blaptoides fortunei]